MRKRDAPLKKSLKSAMNTDRLICKGLRNKVTTQLRKAEATFFIEIKTEVKENSKILWNSINKLSWKGQTQVW